jgi:hypothetical protein
MTSHHKKAIHEQIKLNKTLQHEKLKEFYDKSFKPFETGVLKQISIEKKKSPKPNEIAEFFNPENSLDDLNQTLTLNKNDIVGRKYSVIKDQDNLMVN